jgi:hypothetical protein
MLVPAVTEVPRARRRSTKMGEIIGLGCTHYHGVTVPDERLPETLGRHPVVRDYAETHIFMSAKCFVSYPA